MYFWLKKAYITNGNVIQNFNIDYEKKENLICFRFQGGSVVCDGRDDAAEFADIRSAMKVLMMTDNDIWDILKILAALLHMGNIKYKGKVVANLDATEIPDHTNVERVATILGLDKLALIDALTTRTIFAQGETVVSFLISLDNVASEDFKTLAQALFKF